MTHVKWGSCNFVQMHWKWFAFALSVWFRWKLQHFIKSKMHNLTYERPNLIRRSIWSLISDDMTRQLKGNIVAAATTATANNNRWQSADRTTTGAMWTLPARKNTHTHTHTAKTYKHTASGTKNRSLLATVAKKYISKVHANIQTNVRRSLVIRPIDRSLTFAVACICVCMYVCIAFGRRSTIIIAVVDCWLLLTGVCYWRTNIWSSLALATLQHAL